MSRERRYPSDLTDAQWVLIEPLLPPVKTGGRPEKHPRRDVVDAILYVVRTGLLAVLRRRVRAAHGRAEEPSAGIIDSQSVKGADTAPRKSRGYDAGKKVNGRKRFIVTDTLGLLLIVCVMAASVQDRDGAKTTLLATST
jgi:hypothetical protein